MTMPLSRGEIPPKDPKLHWVECVKPSCEVVFKVFSPKMHKRDVHFILGTGTFPCFPDHRFCEPEHDEKTLRFFGYVFGWHAGRQDTAILQLPVEAARQLMTQFTDGVDLRGSVIRVSRGKTKNSRVTVKRDPYSTFDGVPMANDVCPDASLFRLWEQRRRKRQFGQQPFELPGSYDDGHGHAESA